MIIHKSHNKAVESSSRTKTGISTCVLERNRILHVLDCYLKFGKFFDWLIWGSSSSRLGWRKGNGNSEWRARNIFTKRGENSWCNPDALLISQSVIREGLHRECIVMLPSAQSDVWVSLEKDSQSRVIFCSFASQSQSFNSILKRFSNPTMQRFCLAQRGLRNGTSRVDGGGEDKSTFVECRKLWEIII